MINKILISILLIICFKFSYCQTLDVQYLNPVLGDPAKFRFIRFGNADIHYGGFMWNNTADWFGNGDDFTIFTYENRDIVFRAGDFHFLGGKVGIGTSAPDERLEIFNGRFKVNSGAAIIHLYESDNLKNWFFVADGSSLQIRQNTTASANSAFTIKDNFNIGIGTNSPDHELTVKGTIHSEEVLVDLNVPGPDYVFEEDYPLQDLSSLEQYLKANKHLPEVPSAAEMEKEGIKVGEMEMLLLKKVEELTLHLIRQEKLIKEQKALIIELQEKIK